jgi:hypothetical protein
MATLTFDTHEFIKTLIGAGFSEAQAEAITLGQKTASATTLDNQVTSQILDSRIKETELKIELSGAELKRDLADTRAALIRWAGLGFLQAALNTALLVKILAASA